MAGKTIVFMNGFQIEDDELLDIADKIAKTMISELPEGLQTYEGATYMLEIVAKKLKAMKIEVVEKRCE